MSEKPIALHLAQIDKNENAWLASREVTEKVWEMLGKEGPWKHSYRRSLDWNERCNRCGRHFSDGDCPVPPPLPWKPEVVAKKLRDECLAHHKDADIHPLYFAAEKVFDCPNGYFAEAWFRLYAGSPAKQVLACLVAGGKVGGE
jgi:hypothetical protein